MFDKIQKTIITLAVLGAVAVGASAFASAASNSGTTGAQGNSGTTAQQGNSGTAAPPRAAGHGLGETLLTDGTADKVKQAALDKVSGATVLRVETDVQGSPYEAHLRKSDGSEVTVKVDKQFNVTAVESGFGKGAPPGTTH